PSCQIGDFKVDLHNGPKSAWNVSAAVVFTTHFCDTHQIPLSCDIILDITRRFHGHLKYLKRRYYSLQGTPDSRILMRQINRHWQRKSSRFHRRLEIFEKHPILRVHIPKLQRLGAGGMSSDESDTDIVANPTNSLTGIHPHYVVLQPKWRAASITHLLRCADSLYHIKRRRRTSDM
ncbi:hypothetical protein BDQ17DRAFT_1172918, partial [Cyathus striatus]